MDEITIENEQTTQQTTQESSSVEQIDDKRIIPRWITTKDKIDTNSTDIVDRVVFSILEKAEKYSNGDFFRILLRTLHVNDMSASNHEPIVVRIGPNKWDTTKPDLMAFHKHLYTSDFFERAGIDLEEFLRANFDKFSKSIEMSKLFNNWSDVPDDVLIEMFILDGCFIIELFLKNYDLKNYGSENNENNDSKNNDSESDGSENNENNDSKNNDLESDDSEKKEKKGPDALFSSELLLAALSRDLLLLDNQLPFKVLEILFENSGLLKKSYPDLIELAFEFLERILPTKKLVNKLDSDSQLDLRSVVYEGLSWLRLEANNNSNSNNDQDEKDGDDKWNLVKSATECLEFGVKFKMVDTDNLDDKWNLVKSATELLEFGVEFKVIMTDNFIDIKFTDKGVLEIPRILIRYGTAFSINMLLELENNFFYNINNLDQQRWLSDYVWFVNSLLKSPSDVQLLRQKNIIDNLSELRDDAAILKFLKDSYESLTISPHNFSYRKICRDLNSHCNHRQNRWFAKLKRDYFNSPWAYISFFAAFLLLILTIGQTIFSVASYYKGG